MLTSKGNGLKSTAERFERIEGSIKLNDYKPNIAAQLLTVAGRSFATFALTIAASTAAGLVFAVLSWYVLHYVPWGYRAAAAVLAVAEAFGFGVFLGYKRAAAGAIMFGIHSLGLGRSVVGIVFDRIPLSDRDHNGTSRALVAPEQAVKSVNAAFGEFEHDRAEAGVQARILGRGLFEAVRDVITRRFNDETALIDLGAVRTELERTIDRRLSDRFRKSARVATLLVLAVLPILAAIQIWLFGKLGS